MDLSGTSLRAADDDGVFGWKWKIVNWYNKQFNVVRIGEDFRFYKDEPFDIMKHIYFEDKI